MPHNITQFPTSLLIDSGCRQNINIRQVSRLAPPHAHMPKHYLAQKDVDATWSFITSEINARHLGIDPTRAALYGSSIGCSLSTGLAMRLRDNDSPIRPRIVLLDRYYINAQLSLLPVHDIFSALLDDRVQYPTQTPNHPLLPYQKVSRFIRHHTQFVISSQGLDS